jgi:hypothetical protein
MIIIFLEEKKYYDRLEIVESNDIMAERLRTLERKAIMAERLRNS